MSLAIIKPTDTIPAETTVLAVWGTGTILPGEDALQAAVAPFGQPLQFSYLPRDHVAVKVTGETSAVELTVALAAATSGQAPLLLAVPPALNDAVEIEITGGEISEKLGEVGAAIQNTAKTAGTLGAAIPFLLGAAVVGGILVVGGAIWYFSRKAS